MAINQNGHVFAGTKGGGVLKSTDSGEHWIKVNNGLPATDICAFAINSTGNIFAGTLGGGVFRSADNGGIGYK
ncbi:MAG: hypothetical protein ABI840_10385 [bacterium]